MSCTVITLKFKLRWFPEEAGYSVEKGFTDIHSPPLMSNEEKNISGPLILVMIMCKPRIIKYQINYSLKYSSSPSIQMGPGKL